jgi:hypothetical protein
MARARSNVSLVSRHEGFLAHGNYKYAKVMLAIIVVCALSYGLIDVEPRHNGGSWYGYVLGTVGFGLILWLTTLGIRKRAITPGMWSLKAWTSAHVYLGLSLIVIGTLHTGFQFGWNVHTLAYVLMMLVILTGLWGVYNYWRLPRVMSDNRGERSQIQMLEELNSLDRELAKITMPISDAYTGPLKLAMTQSPIGGSLGQRLSGRVANCGTHRALEILKSQLARDGRTMSDSDRKLVGQAVGILDRKDMMLKRTRQHIRYRTLLELWLYIHVPLTFALIAALVAHVVSVFFYW